MKTAPTVPGHATTTGGKALKSVLPLLAAFVITAAQAQSTITFDDVACGTAIDNVYAGLNFSNPLGGSIYAGGPNCRSGTHVLSPPNNVSIHSGGEFFNARSGAVDVTFAALRQWVSIDVQAALSGADGTKPTLRPFIEAYDSSGNLIARTFFQGVLPDFGSSAWETMTVSMPTATIKRVRFSVQTSSAGPAVYGYFDNLRMSAGFVKCSRWSCP